MNITASDYDASESAVNRLKLMLATAFKSSEWEEQQIMELATETMNEEARAGTKKGL